MSRTSSFSHFGVTPKQQMPLEDNVQPSDMHPITNPYWAEGPHGFRGVDFTIDTHPLDALINYHTEKLRLESYHLESHIDYTRYADKLIGEQSNRARPWEINSVPEQIRDARNQYLRFINPDVQAQLELMRLLNEYYSASASQRLDDLQDPREPAYEPWVWPRSYEVSAEEEPWHWQQLADEKSSGSSAADEAGESQIT